MRDLSDAELVECFKAGDEQSDEAFGELARRYGPEVRRVAWRLLAALDLTDYVEDATQSAWQTVFPLLPDIDMSRPLLPWLNEVTARVVKRFRDCLYRATSRCQPETDVGEGFLAEALCSSDDGRTPATVLSEALEVAQVFDTYGEKIPLLMVITGGNISEVAQRCDCSPRTVYLHWSTALPAFRAVMRDGRPLQQTVRQCLSKALRKASG